MHTRLEVQEQPYVRGSWSCNLSMIYKTSWVACTVLRWRIDKYGRCIAKLKMCREREIIINLIVVASNQGDTKEVDKRISIIFQFCSLFLTLLIFLVTSWALFGGRGIKPLSRNGYRVSACL